MSMFNTGDILETIEMFTQDNLDVRTVTMGISLLDCIDPDPKKACENIYNKITTKAANLVPAVEHISAEYGIPIINKRISVTPIAMLLGACPAIEDVPDGGLNAVKSYYEDVAKALLPDRRVGLMHGKLKPKEKAAVMEDFKAGRLDALVSTTVIEVGVDVPNASVMVIENAERYGLSALHQLRGRVGRGAVESWCFLVSDNQSEAVQKRLKFLCSTTDGFAVAQYDLETRGPGDFFGSRQHGLPTLQIADLMNDTRTLHAAQAEAAALLAEDPLLAAPEHALLEAQVQQMFDKAGAMN